MKRTFISINFSEETIEKTGQIQSMLIKEIGSGPIKWEAADKFHITLFFAGDSTDAMLEKIDSSLSRIIPEFDFEKITLRLKGIGGFPNLKYPRVIFINVDNPDGILQVISGKIISSMKLIGFKTDKPFRPHVTLGRVRRDKKINLVALEKLKLSEYSFEVNSLFLMESRLGSSGSEYSAIKEFKF